MRLKPILLSILGIALSEMAPMPPPPMPMRQRPVLYIPPTTPVLRAMQDMTLKEVVDYWKTNRQNCAVMQWRFR